MKKMFLSMICLASLATASAQFSGGAKAGAQLTGSTGSDADEKSKIGFYGGFYGRYHFAENLSAQAELLYSAQGAKDKEGDGKTNTSYLNVPILFQYHLPVGLYFETGPQIGFLMSAKYKNEGEDMDVKKAMKSTDFSWALGAGYKITEEIGINARYTHGLSKVGKDIGEFEAGKVYNNAIQLGISWQLFGGK